MAMQSCECDNQRDPHDRNDAQEQDGKKIADPERVIAVKQHGQRAEDGQHRCADEHAERDDHDSPFPATAFFWPHNSP